MLRTLYVSKVVLLQPAAGMDTGWSPMDCPNDFVNQSVPSPLTSATISVPKVHTLLVKPGEDSYHFRQVVAATGSFRLGECTRPGISAATATKPNTTPCTHSTQWKAVPSSIPHPTVAPYVRLAQRTLKKEKKNSRNVAHETNYDRNPTR
jgi:hypothetical protein